MTAPKTILDILNHTNPFRSEGFWSRFGSKKKDQKNRGKSRKILVHGDTRLIILYDTERSNINFLRQNYSFHPIHLDDIVSPIQRPKIDVEDDYIFFVVHIPQFNPATKKIEFTELDMFLIKNDLLMVFNHSLEPLEVILGQLDKKEPVREEYFSKGSGVLLYHIVDSLIDGIFPLLEQLEQGIDLIDREVFSKAPQNIAERVSFLRRNVIYFQTLIRPELNSFVRLEETNHKLISREFHTYLGNITDHLKKIWDRLEDIKELSDNLSTTYGGYITFKTNEIIKVLTIFSVILLPLTLLSGIYGMNLAVLPLADHPMALFLIGVLMSAIVFLMLAFFKLKHWI